MALPLLLLLLGYAGPQLFAGFLTLVVGAALSEYNRMGLSAALPAARWLSAVAGAVLIPLLYLYSTAALLPWLTALFFGLSLLLLFHFESLEKLRQQLGWLLAGQLYLPLLLAHLLLLRQLPQGQRWIFMTLLAVMACDTFAYFFGRKFGRRKLYQAVSPNKSIEGAVAGLAGAVLAVLLARALFLPLPGVVGAVLIGLLLGVAGQLGDLFESLLKRACQVKDSGNMIPGHGGLLDRLDSLLFTFPLVYYLARYVYGG